MSWRNACTVAGGVIGLLLGVAGVAEASGGGLTWAIQDTGVVGMKSALGMRSGLVWPVVFTEEQSGTATSLFAVENPDNNTNWHTIGVDLFPFGGGRLRAESSATGRVLVVASMGGGAVLDPAIGFTSLPASARAAAFDAAGNVVTAGDLDVPAFPNYPGDTIVDIATSPDGAVAVVDFTGYYHEYNPLLGQWLSDRPGDDASVDLAPESLALAFDADGRPHIVGNDRNGDRVTALDFDIPTGQWQATDLGSSAFSDQEFELSADSQGTVGTAYQVNEQLMYASRTGLDPWSIVTVPVGSPLLATTSAGIAYDHNDFPVISFSQSGIVHLAYDPPVRVPEPTAGAVLLVPALGLLMGRRRRHGM